MENLRVDLNEGVTLLDGSHGHPLHVVPQGGFLNKRLPN
jgi:hypothetical protein